VNWKLVLLVAATLVVGAAHAGEAGWDKIIGADPDKLSDVQRTQAAQMLTRIDNTRGCKGTLAKCLAAGDQTARRHAGYVLRMARKGKNEAFVKAGIAKRHESAFPSETFEPDLGGHPSFGGASAKVVLVEYACFQCPYCAHLAPKLKKLKSKFGGKVAHYYKFFPVRSHKRGVHSALAGLAAHKQGKFWKLYDLMYANRNKLEDDHLREYAQSAGLDLARFDADLEDKALMKVIEKDKLEGMRFGVEGTPTFFVNGKLYQGASDYPEIVDRIGEELDIVEGRIK
jgi:protein-disulfide isomerase